MTKRSRAFETTYLQGTVEYCITINSSLYLKALGISFQQVPANPKTPVAMQCKHPIFPIWFNPLLFPLLPSSLFTLHLSLPHLIS